MTLGEQLEKLKYKPVKVGSHSGFIYCGNVDKEAYSVLKNFMDREVLDVYNSIDEIGAKIVIFEGKEKGLYYSTHECNEKNKKIVKKRGRPSRSSKY